MEYIKSEYISIIDEDIILKGHLVSVPFPKAWVLFAHGSGSSHLSPRNNWVANKLNEDGYSTFLFDLLSPEEASLYKNRFDILLLATRLLKATDWLIRSEHYQEERPIVYFGASTGAAAALVAATKAQDSVPIFSIISRGGRVDLAGEALSEVRIPTLLIVGEQDFRVIELNRKAMESLQDSSLVLIPYASHLFEEPGTLTGVADTCLDWLNKHLPSTLKESA